MKISEIITYLSTSIVPIVGLIITIITSRNDSKKKEIQNQINGGTNNSINNTNITLSPTIKLLQQQERRLSDFQQNIDTLRKIFINLSPLLLIIIFLTNFYENLFPLPNLVWNIDSIGTNSSYIIHSLYVSIFPSINNFLILIALVSIALAIKIIIMGRKVTSILLAISYGILAVIYYIVSINPSLTLPKINLPDYTHIGTTFNDFISIMLPGAVILCLIFAWIIASTIMLKMFETKETSPNLKLLKVSLPRFAFYILALVLPFAIVAITEYSQH